MKGIFSGVINNITGRFPPGHSGLAQQGVSVDYQLVNDVEAARRDWMAAKTYFQSVTEPDLVDHAIFLVEAAEKKYMYLLKKAREAGVNIASSE